MKNAILSIITLLVIASIANGQDRFVESKITHVTVYLKGAYITRTLNTQGLEGKQDLWVKDLPKSINLKSITTEAKENVDIISITPKQDRFMKDFETTPEVDSLLAVKSNYRDSTLIIGKMLEVLRKEMEMIEAHDDLSDNNGNTDVDQLIKASEFYRMRIKDIELEMLDLNKILTNYQEILKEVTEEYNTLSEKYRTITTRINIKVEVKSPGEDLIKIKYYTPLATWSPYYDIKTKSISEDISLYRKAHVSQNTDEDWTSVKLKLSNANPLESTYAPVLQVYDILGHRHANSYDKIKVNERFSEELEEVAMPQALSANISEIVIDGSRTKKKEAIRKPLNQTKIDAISSVEYAIALPFTIPSDSKPVDVLLQQSTIPTIYEYYTAPTKTQKAYLIAQIPNWHKLDLLEGTANLFLSNSYKGTTNINPKSTQDTLNISLGADPEIIVERDQVMDLYSKKFFGKNAEENLTYKISVKNNKDNPISIKIMDQIPVSFHKDVKIDLEEKTNAKYDAEKGFLTWERTLSSGESSEQRFSYKIKYPKSLSVEL